MYQKGWPFILSRLIIYLAFIFLTVVPILTMLKVRDYDLVNFFDQVSAWPTQVTSQVIERVSEDINLPPPLIKPDSAPEAFLTVNGVLQWTNTQRINASSAGPFLLNSQLNQIANLRRDDMFTNQYFAHNNPTTGVGAAKLAPGAGYEYIAIGENIALGNFADDEELVQAWMDSPGHRENIVDPSYTEIGIAVGQGVFDGQETWMAVQVFGKPLSACPNPDETLLAQIESGQEQIEILNVQINQLSKDLNRPPRGRSKQAVDEYNAKVEEYNALVEQIQELSAQVKGWVDEYNAQVKAFNTCAAA